MIDPARETPPLAGELLAALLLDQRRRWQSGERVRVETYLERQPDLHSDTELLLDLIYNEFILREQQGETPRLEEYLERFPQLTEQLRLQFEMDQAFQAGDLLPSGQTRRTLAISRRGDSERMTSSLPELPGYQVLELIGRGGMGVVYRARQLGLNRQVALKMIRGGDDTDPEQLARFRAEAEAVARLQHPNIVQIHEIGEWQAGSVSPPVPYLSLEYVDGGSLDKKLAGTPQPARQAAALVETLARAMHTAHQQGIVHRDLKPANVLLSFSRDAPAERSAGASQLNEAVPKISDFGLAKRLDVSLGQTRTGAVMGTPSYMAPEQAQGRNQDVGPAADVYALGAMLYEMLTGRPPFRGESPLDTLQQVMTREPVAPRQLQPKVPRDLETICLKCLQKEPRRRYASAQELADDLRRFQNHEPIQARPVGRAERLWRWCKRKPAVAGLLAALIVIVTAALISETWLLVRAERLRKEADDRRSEAETSLREEMASVALAQEGIDKYLVRVSEDLRMRQEDLRTLRKDLLQDAVPLYEKLLQRRHGDTPAVQAERGSAYRKLAHLTQMIDDRDRSRKYFEEAIAIFERLTSEQPDVPSHFRELGVCHNDLGIQYAEANREVEAEQQFRKALAIWEPLVRDYPEVVEYPHQQAISYMNLGNNYLKTKRPDEARAEYSKALKVREALAQRDPKNVENQRGRSNLHINLGTLSRRNRDLPQARLEYQQACDILEQLVLLRPKASEFQHDLATSRTNLGQVMLLIDPSGKGEEELLQALKLREDLARQHGSVTNYQLQLIQLYRTLAEHYLRTKRVSQGEGEYRKAVELCDRLVRQYPRVRAYQEQQARVCYDLAFHFGQTERPVLAEAEYRQAIQVYDRLVREHENVPVLQQSLARALSNLVGIYRQLRRPKEAEAACDRAIQVQEQLVANHANDLDYVVDLAASYERKAKLADDRGDTDAALEWYERGITHLTAVRKQKPEDIRTKRFLIVSHANRAETLTKASRYPEALKDWDQAIALDSGVERDLLRLDRAGTVAQMGDHARAVQEAKSIPTKGPASPRLLYARARVDAFAASAAARDDKLSETERRHLSEQNADQALKFLAQAIAAGYRNINQLTGDAAFDVVRSREEFKELLLKLEKPPG